MAANEFSTRGLARVHRVLSGYVQRGAVPGLVAALAKRDSTHIEVLGRLDADRGEAVTRDSIFRIASTTKPITAVAALMLVEDCVLRLDDPVEEFLPGARRPARCSRARTARSTPRCPPIARSRCGTC